MYFCSVIGPTEPNRLYSISATLDPAGTHGGPCVKTTFTLDQGLIGNFRWTTMPEQLQARGISWKSYTAGGAAFGQADSPFGAFEQFRNKPNLHRLGIAPTYPQDFLTTSLKIGSRPSRGSRSRSSSLSTPARLPRSGSTPSIRCSGRSGVTRRSGVRRP